MKTKSDPPTPDPIVTINLMLFYVGKLPVYFPLFLRSCAANPTVNWTILTTTPVLHMLPPNVQNVIFDLRDFANRVKSETGVSPIIERPYKLCDFRPAFAILYPELTHGYDYWGHCDADVVFGNIRKFFPNEILQNQTKVQMRGAFSLYRNSNEGNRLFELPHPQINYRNVFSNPKYCGFDEWEGIHKLLKKNGLSYYLSNDIAEISISRYDLRLSHRKNFGLQVFTWEDGRILRTAWENDVDIVDEYAYIHLQKRKIRKIDDLMDGNFAFLPAEIISLDSSVDKKFLAQRNRRNFYWEAVYHLGRVRRRIQSRNLVDRAYWRIPL